MSIRKNFTHEEIIAKMKEVHGDKYGYERFVFNGVSNKSIMTCPIHGDWEQTIGNHLQGKCCPRCAKARVSTLKLDTSTFIAQAKARHGDKYDYSKSVYVQARERLTITCPIHGDFLCSPDNHKRGKGCSPCGDIKAAAKRSISEEEFKKRMVEEFGDLYDLSDIGYTGYDNRITLTCKVHGKFKATPTTLINSKSGCPKCGKLKAAESRSYTTEQLLERAHAKHDNKYEYPEDMRGILGKQRIICPIHGEFFQDLHSHINGGSGCPACAAKTCGFRQNLAGSIYLLSNESCLKVGITNKTVKWRTMKVNGYHSKDKFSCIESFSGKGYDCLLAETELLAWMDTLFVKPFTAPVDGYTEIFAVPEESRNLVIEKFNEVCNSFVLNKEM